MLVRETDVPKVFSAMLLDQKFVTELRQTLLSDKIERLKSKTSHLSDRIESVSSHLKDSIDGVEARLRNVIINHVERELDGKIDRYVPKVIIQHMGRALADYLLKHDELIRLQGEVIDACRSTTEYQIRDFLHKITQEDQYHMIFDTYSKTLQHRLDQSLSVMDEKIRVVDKAMLDEVKSLNLRADSSFTELRKKQDDLLKEVQDKEKALSLSLQKVNSLQIQIYILGVGLAAAIGCFLFRK